MNPKPLNRIKQFHARLWRAGKKIGKIKGELIIELEPMIKQQLFGIQTENGIVKTESNLMVSLNHSSVSSQVSKLFSNLERIFNKLKSLINEYFGSKKKESDSNLKESIQELKSILISNQVTNLSLNELMQSQTQCIKIARFLLQYASEMEDTPKLGAFESIKLILKRAELSLIHLGFEKSDPKFHQRKEIAASYMGLLNQCLRLALTGIRQKGLEDVERDFVQYSLSYCYFRYVPFRELIEKLLNEPFANDSSYHDWKKFYNWKNTQQVVQIKHRGESPEKHFDHPIAQLIDWGCYLFCHLEGSSEYTEEMVVFEELTADGEWRKNISKKGVGFFYFVAESSNYLVEHIDSLILSKIDFLEIPGYDALLCAFMHELKSKEYSDALVHALGCAVDSNYRLVNAVFPIIALRTK